MLTPRRQSLKALGIATLGISVAATTAAASAGDEIPAAAGALETLTKHLAALPRRRDFKTVPMILDHPDLWDAEALNAVLRYPSGPKQSWDNSELTGPWLNVMRNAMNAEIWSFRHPDFLCVSATHGPAQLALYDDAMWDKYGLAKLAGGNVTHNTFVAAAAPVADHDPKNYNDPNGIFSPHGNNIQTLQRRGLVFTACHNAVWELAQRLVASDVNPDKLSGDALCAELSNHLIEGVILTPGATGTLVELAKAGFAYAR
jgi:hypothetical protein